MPRLFRAVIRPFMTVVVAVMLIVASLTVGASTSYAEDDREPVVVPSDVYKPPGSKIPVMWKVTPGRVTFYSAQTDPEFVNGAYYVTRDDQVVGGKEVNIYTSASYRLTGGKRYTFVANPYASLTPEKYTIYIPRSGTGGVISKLTNRSKAYAAGKAYSSSGGVKVVKVAIRSKGKYVRSFRVAKGTTAWRATFKRLKKGKYTVVTRITPKQGGTKVVKRNFVVR